MKITEVAVNTQGLTLEQANHLFDIADNNGLKVDRSSVDGKKILRPQIRYSYSCEDFSDYMVKSDYKEITYSQFVELFDVKADPTLEEIDAQIKALEEKKKELELKNKKFGVFWDDDGSYKLGFLYNEPCDDGFVSDGLPFHNFIELDLDQNPQLKEIVSKFN